MRRWRWRVPRRAAVIGLVAAVVLVLVVAGRLGVGSPGRTPPRPVPPATATGPITVESAPPTTVAAVVGKPVDHRVGARQLALAAGSLWVAAQDSNQVVRVDPISGRVSAVIPVRQPLGIAAGFGALWVTSYGEQPALLRINPVSLRVTARTPLEVAAAVAASAGAVWVACGEGNGPSLQRVDPASGRVTARIWLAGRGVTGCGLWSMAAEGRWVWVGNEAGALWRIDATSNRASALGVSLSGASSWARPGHLVAVGGMVWAASDRQLLRVDPNSGRMVTQLDGGVVGDRSWNFGSGLAALAVPGRPPLVWWASSEGLFQVDPRRNLLAATIPMPAGVSVIEDLVAGTSGLWAITDQGVVRVDHARGRVREGSRPMP